MNKEYTAGEFLALLKEHSSENPLEITECTIQGADLHGADFSGASMTLCNFEDCDLTGAIFDRADIHGTLFLNCPMHGCSFVDANMQETVFRDIDLSDSDISGADIFCAVLEGANLEGLKTSESTKWYRMVPPEEGPFIAWKCCTELRVVQLLVPADARRVSATALTCRCDKAKVLSIKSIDETVKYDWAQSTVDPDFYYEVGKWVEPANGFEPDRWKDSSRGIHFFMERQQAVDYQSK